MPTFEQDQVRLEMILCELKPVLPDGQWFLNGSAVLVLNGIDNGRGGMGDLDIFLATRSWFEIFRIYGTANPDVHNGWKLVTPNPDDFRERADPPYLLRVMRGLPVHLFFNWRIRHVADIDVNFLIHNAEIVGGWPCAPLQMVADWKAQKLRAKDAIDLAAIARARPDMFPLNTVD